MPDERPHGVTITTADMYALLVDIDKKVTALATTSRSTVDTLRDHEDRLRAIEAMEDQSRRLGNLESSVEALKVRVYAIPGASVLVAVAAVVITLIRTY